ncbi:alpha/beta fold hydrolase [Gulosibacter molinativorax]|uniref:Alpha/beta hydrolase n=1 Tax=Gulosibacter molinativorax TaxID=256821 RepID=A0ABT7C6U7_9MICO|nr:alpha/beta hydrolase [Gulosibacter molinativorax]MDJ1370882.1 alpha/beta hydrolase [Gulosibacter molinativorax]QUY62219.1 3-oxoadipate enol-lactonase [Gulosibacter molinativorax]
MTASRDTPVVLLHGVGLDRSMWQSTTARLAQRGRDAVALDLPGHGAQPPLTSKTSLRELAEDVLARMPEGESHLVGFSLGALIAQHIARYFPERIASLTSVSSVCQRTPEESASVLERLETARCDIQASTERSIHRWYPQGTTVSAEEIAETRRILEANDPDSFLYAYEVFATGDQELADELQRIHAPALAITGELDPGSTPEMTRRLAAAIPGCRASIVPDARHMLPLEATDTFVAELNTLFDAANSDDATTDNLDKELR